MKNKDIEYLLSQLRADDMMKKNYPRLYYLLPDHIRDHYHHIHQNHREVVSWTQVKDRIQHTFHDVPETVQTHLNTIYTNLQELYADMIGVHNLFTTHEKECIRYLVWKRCAKHLKTPDDITSYADETGRALMMSWFEDFFVCSWA